MPPRNRNAARDPELVELGRRVRELRADRGKSQETLAHDADLHWTYVSQIERGLRNCTFKNLRRLARGLDVDVAELFRPPGSPVPLIAVGARDPDALGDMLDRYDAECVAATQKMPLADRTATAAESPAEFVRRLVAEERRFVLEAQLRWIDYAREELRARSERRRSGGGHG